MTSFTGPPMPARCVGAAVACGCWCDCMSMVECEPSAEVPFEPPCSRSHCSRFAAARPLRMSRSAAPTTETGTAAGERIVRRVRAAVAGGEEAAGERGPLADGAFIDVAATGVDGGRARGGDV